MDSKPPTPASEEDALVARLAAGDQQALLALIEHWQRPLYSLVYRMVGDHGVTEEVLQDAFYKAWKQAAQFDPSRGRFSSWLFSIAHHQAIDALRRRRARGADLASPSGELASFPNAAPQSEVSPWQKLRMESALAGLAPAQRRLIEMAYYRGLTREEIAQELKVPLGTLKTQLRSALLQLRKLFKDPEPSLKSV